MEKQIKEIINNDMQLFERVKVEVDAGISHELISENHKSLGPELLCMICLDVVLNPTMCAECENLFCKNCINKMLKKSNKCPNQCVFIQKEKNIMLKKLLNKIEFHCLYYKSGCKDIIIYSDFISHINNCDYGIFYCKSPNCDYQNIKFEIKDHVLTCAFREFLCNFCNLKFVKKNLNEHIEVCGNKEIYCKFCKDKFTNKTLDSHIEVCDYFELKCEECNNYIRRNIFKSHDKVECLTMQVKYWRECYIKLEERNKELEQEIKEKERVNSLVVDLSAKLLESNNRNRYNNVNSFEEILALPSMRNNHNSNRINNNINNSLLNSVNSLNQLSLNNQNNSFSNLVQPINNGVLENYSYEGVEIKSINSLNGIIYAIVDLNNYKNNLAACGSYNSIVVFNVESMDQKFSLNGHTNYIWSLMHLLDYKNELLASGSQDNSIRIWNLDTQQCLNVLYGHSNWVTCLSSAKFRPGAFISSSYDHECKIWDIESGNCLDTINNLFGKNCLNLTKNNNYIIFGTIGNSLSIYDYSIKQIKGSIHGHTNLINCICETNLDNIIASGSDDWTIRISNYETYSSVAVLKGHTGCITYLSLLSELQFLISTSDDKTIRIWNLNDYTCVGLINTFSSYVKVAIPISQYFCSVLTHGDVGNIKHIKIENKNN